MLRAGWGWPAPTPAEYRAPAEAPPSMGSDRRPRTDRGASPGARRTLPRLPGGEGARAPGEAVPDVQYFAGLAGGQIRVRTTAQPDHRSGQDAPGASLGVAGAMTGPAGAGSVLVPGRAARTGRAGGGAGRRPRRRGHETAGEAMTRRGVFAVAGAGAAWPAALLSGCGASAGPPAGGQAAPGARLAAEKRVEFWGVTGGAFAEDPGAPPAGAAGPDQPLRRLCPRPRGLDGDDPEDGHGGGVQRRA